MGLGNCRKSKLALGYPFSILKAIVCLLIKPLLNFSILLRMFLLPFFLNLVSWLGVILLITNFHFSSFINLQNRFAEHDVLGVIQMGQCMNSR